MYKDIAFVVLQEEWQERKYNYYKGGTHGIS